MFRRQLRLNSNVAEGEKQVWQLDFEAVNNSTASRTVTLSYLLRLKSKQPTKNKQELHDSFHKSDQ